jgi:Cu2+-exporting ATPase
VLETLHRATHIVFDKTGTLTAGRPMLRQIDVFAGISKTHCLQIAAALEKTSAHPLGIAIVQAAYESELHAADVQSIPGQGLEGTVDGMRYRLGSYAFVRGFTNSSLVKLHSVNDASGIRQDCTSVYLGTCSHWLARFDLADGLRDDARQVVKQFQQQGKKVILLSGDRQAVTKRVAHELGIDSALGDCLPEQKLAFVQSLQRDGAVVAMVGDGINDAAVLKAADVSFAMGSGTALAQMHADCVLISGRLSSIADVAQTASKTIAVIRENLAWASLYNVIAIPAAAIGLLNPWLSGIGMSVSSAVVVLNALRLRRIPAVKANRQEKVKDGSALSARAA